MSDGYDRLQNRIDAAGEKMAGRLADHPRRFILGSLFKLFLAVVLLGLLIGGVGWLAGWWGAAKDVTGPANVANQYYQVRQDWQGMITASQNACGAQQAVKSAGDPVLVEDPTLAYASTYRNIRTDFNRRQNDIFEAGKVGPGGYPKTVKIFPEELKTPIEWCSIATKLEAIHD